MGYVTHRKEDKTLSGLISLSHTQTLLDMDGRHKHEEKQTRGRENHCGIELGKIFSRKIQVHTQTHAHIYTMDKLKLIKYSNFALQNAQLK